jgi:hypothetical protein
VVGFSLAALSLHLCQRALVLRSVAMRPGYHAMLSYWDGADLSDSAGVGCGCELDPSSGV